MLFTTSSQFSHAQPCPDNGTCPEYQDMAPNYPAKPAAELENMGATEAARFVRGEQCTWIYHQLFVFLAFRGRIQGAIHELPLGSCRDCMRLGIQPVICFVAA